MNWESTRFFELVLGLFLIFLGKGLGENWFNSEYLQYNWKFSQICCTWVWLPCGQNQAFTAYHKFIGIMLYKCRYNYLNKLRYYSILKVFFNSTEFYFLARQHVGRFWLKYCTFHKTSFSQARVGQHGWRFCLKCCTFHKTSFFSS